MLVLLGLACAVFFLVVSRRHVKGNTSLVGLSRGLEPSGAERDENYLVNGACPVAEQVG
jgi:hypothetical protein